jgi:hypothetical protein
MYQKLLFLVLFCGVFSHVQSQVVLSGNVTHEDEVVNGVVIQVLENDRIQRTISANKRGRYQIEFDYGHEYLLVFRASYMIPVKIEINTKLQDSKLSEVKIDVPLNMTLFKRYKGMDISAYDKPIGVVLNSGTGEQAFSFVADPLVLAEIQEVNAEAKRRAENGERPIEIVETEVLTDGLARSIANSEEKGKKVIDVNVQKELKKLDSNVIDKMEATPLSRFEAIEKAEDEKVQYRQKRQNQFNESVTDQKALESDFIYGNKAIRKETFETNKMEENQALDARIKKQNQFDEILILNAESRQPIGPRIADDIKLLEKKKEEGTFFDEETLIVQQGMIKNTYKITTQNWLFFEVNYYYKNGKEISEDEYFKMRNAID